MPRSVVTFHTRTGISALAYRPSSARQSRSSIEERSSNLPCDTDTDREFGRTAIATGMPIRSSPVMLPSRVSPMRAIYGRTRARVSRGSATRCVPRRNRLGCGCSAAQAIWLAPKDHKRVLSNLICGRLPLGGPYQFCFSVPATLALSALPAWLEDFPATLLVPWRELRVAGAGPELSGGLEDAAPPQ